jgi:hypothetical protein
MSTTISRKRERQQRDAAPPPPISDLSSLAHAASAIAPSATNDAATAAVASESTASDDSTHSGTVNNKHEGLKVVLPQTLLNRTPVYDHEMWKGVEEDPEAWWHLHRQLPALFRAGGGNPEEQPPKPDEKQEQRDYRQAVMLNAGYMWSPVQKKAIADLFAPGWKQQAIDGNHPFSKLLGTVRPSSSHHTVSNSWEVC